MIKRMRLLITGILEFHSLHILLVENSKIVHLSPWEVWAIRITK
jgi:hypothetical protein